MRAIDARTDALMRERAARLGGGAISPPLRTGDSPTASLAALSEKEPPSTNPPASALTFKLADESRNVNERLKGYQTQPNTEVLRLDLLGALRQAQLTGREFLDAEEEYMLAAIRLLIQRHDWDPHFFNDTTVEVNRANRPNNGNYTTPLRIINELKATQRLPYGGQVEASWIWDATEQLRDVVSGSRYQQASALVLSGSVPLLRGAGLYAQQDLIQGERNLVYAARTFEDFRRAYLVDIASAYFDLVQIRDSIANQERSLQLVTELEERTKALLRAGRVAEFQVNIASSDVLKSTSALSNLREAYILAVDRFKIRLGLSVDQVVEIAPVTLQLPEPDVTPAEATILALDYRLDLQTRRDRVDDSRRAVLNRRNELLPDLKLNGALTARTNPLVRDVGAMFDEPDYTYGAGVTFGLPLDRETERLNLRASMLDLARSQRDLEKFRDDIIVDVRARVRDLDRARFNLQLAEKSVEINMRRREEQEIKANEVTPQQVIETSDSLRQAENSRDLARTDLRKSVLEYLRATGQLRVARDGTLQPLPGMPANEGLPVDPPATPRPDSAAPAPAAAQEPVAAPAPSPAD